MREYIDKLTKALNAIDEVQVKKLIELIEQARKARRRIYVCGNGGSASTANHIATDLSFGTRLKLNPIQAISLSANEAIITATGNDLSFEEIFSRQLSNLGQKGDLLLVVSASGNSINIIRAVEEAKSIGLEMFAILGFDGGNLLQLIGNYILVPTDIGEYGIVEDAHLAISHYVTEYIRSKNE